jgi:hypothetical protein
MTRSLATFVCSVCAALGAALAEPQAASAQNFGFELNLGNAGFSYQQGYPSYPAQILPGGCVVPPPRYYPVPVPVAPPVVVYPRSYYPRPYYPAYRYGQNPWNGGGRYPGHHHRY